MVVVVVMEVEAEEEVEGAGAVVEEGVAVVAVEEADQVDVAAMEVAEAVAPMIGKVVSYLFSRPQAAVASFSPSGACGRNKEIGRENGSVRSSDIVKERLKSDRSAIQTDGD